VNRALTRISLACLVMFILLLININYVQAFQSSTLAGEPENSRTFNQQFLIKRGAIYATGDGSNTLIAGSKLVKNGGGKYQRYYPEGPTYAPVTGYDSIFGKTGIEEAENKFLTGTASSLGLHNFISLITGKPTQGSTVSLTISPKAQKAAYQALLNDGGHEGGVVAINPSTGAILAMASDPSFNPNAFTTLNSATLNTVSQRLNAAKNEPLLSRATQKTFPPGSTFKIITSSAAFSTGLVGGVNSPVNAPTQLSLKNGHFLINDDNGPCADGHPPIIQAFWLSCNTAFGGLGMRLGGAALHKYANLYGFNNAHLNVPIPVTPSVVPASEDAPAFTAFTAIGQFDDAVTPFQEAMIAAAVANNGTLMKPYLVQRIQAPDESVIQSATPAPLSKPVSPAVASDLTQMMIDVTQQPTGTAYATANKTVTGGIEIAGKTGTAQNGINNTNLDDAVFTCFAPANNPKIAVGVIVKGGGFGAAAAAPIAVKVIQAFLGKS
jgi:peptidoglycan glycosyltransferase